MKIYKKGLGTLISKVDEKYFIERDLEIFEVNETAARIVTLCDGKTEIESIAEKLSKLFDKDIEIVFNDTIFFIDQLLELGILTESNL